MILAYSFLTIFLMTLAGLPQTTQYADTSLVTILPAPITAPAPIVTFGKMTALSPIQTLSPIDTGPYENNFLLCGEMSVSIPLTAPCELSEIVMSLPNNTPFPNVILLMAVICALPPMLQLFPIVILPPPDYFDCRGDLCVKGAFLEFESFPTGIACCNYFISSFNYRSENRQYS